MLVGVQVLGVSGLWVWGLGFRVYGLGFRVSGFCTPGFLWPLLAAVLAESAHKSSRILGSQHFGC